MTTHRGRAVPKQGPRPTRLRNSPESPETRHRVRHVVEHIGKSIEDHLLHPGDRLPSEREMAHQLQVSRATIRDAIGYLAAMGVLKIRQGAGTFVSDGPPEIGRLSLGLIGALHGFQPWQMFETRIILERSLAALAAERGKNRHLAALAGEVAEMYATRHDPAQYLIHDVRFHRAIASASGNPILAALMETIVTALYENRRETVQGATNLSESADIHREIYHAIRAQDAAHAGRLMEQHLRQAEAAQLAENAQTAAGSPSHSSATAIVRPLTGKDVQLGTES